jgi:hypothetical protein
MDAASLLAEWCTQVMTIKSLWQNCSRFGPGQTKYHRWALGQNSKLNFTPDRFVGTMNDLRL